MTTKDLITALNQEANNDPVFKDLALVLGARKRARSTLTVRALKLQMERQKFQHDEEQIIKALRSLARLGLGKLDLDPKGRVRALKEIRIKLSSIGKAAYGEPEAQLKNFKPTRHYGELKKPVEENKPFVERRLPRNPRPWQTPGATVIVTVLLGGKPVNIPIPAELSPQEIAALVEKFMKGS